MAYGCRRSRAEVTSRGRTRPRSPAARSGRSGRPARRRPPVSPSRISPASSALASWSPIAVWTSRRSGRAPYTGSKPVSASHSRAACVTSSVSRRSASRRASAGDLEVDDLGPAPRLPSASKTTTSSSRLRNSGLNVRPHDRQHRVLLRRRPVSVGSTRNVRAEVRGQDQDRVAEVDGAALAVGQPTVVEHLQQDVEDLRVRLLDLVEQHHACTAGGAPPRSAGRPPRSRRSRAARRPAGRPSASRRTRSCRCGPSRARRRTGSRPAPWPARSCRRRSGRGTGTSRSAGPGRRCRPAPGVRRRTPRARPRRWPISRRPSSSSIRSSLPVSPSSSRPAGMPVQAATTSATSSGPTSSLTIGAAALVRPRRACARGRQLASPAAGISRVQQPGRGRRGRRRAGPARPGRAGRRAASSARRPGSARTSPAPSGRSARRAAPAGRRARGAAAPAAPRDAASASFASAISSIRSRSTARCSSSISTGRESISIRSRDAASSTRSIALSGRNRAVM